MEFQNRRLQDSRNIDLESFLMDLAGNLRHMSLMARHHAQIPAYLAELLELKSLCLAIVKSPSNQQCKIAFLASYPSPTTAPPCEDLALRNRILDIGNRLLSVTPGSRQSEAESFDDLRFNSNSRHLIVHQLINPAHVLLFILQTPANELSAPLFTKDVLKLAAAYLAKLLRMTFECDESPAKLGRSFANLTKTEWSVLCALDSEDGEKQLAGHLGLSPHTLHSHIKNIYRKVGVGARIAVLQKVEEARFEYHLREHSQEPQGLALKLNCEA